MFFFLLLWLLLWLLLLLLLLLLRMLREHGQEVVVGTMQQVVQAIVLIIDKGLQGLQQLHGHLVVMFQAEHVMNCRVGVEKVVSIVTVFSPAPSTIIAAIEATREACSCSSGTTTAIVRTRRRRGRGRMRSHILQKMSVVLNELSVAVGQIQERIVIVGLVLII